MKSLEAKNLDQTRSHLMDLFEKERWNELKLKLNDLTSVDKIRGHKEILGTIYKLQDAITTKMNRSEEGFTYREFSDEFEGLMSATLIQSQG